MPDRPSKASSFRVQTLRPHPSSSSLLRRVARRVLGAADRALGRALGLVHLALGLRLGVAGRRAHGILDGTLGLAGRARDAVLVHGGSPPSWLQSRWNAAQGGMSA